MSAQQINFGMLLPNQTFVTFLNVTGNRTGNRNLLIALFIAENDIQTKADISSETLFFWIKMTIYALNPSIYNDSYIFKTFNHFD